MSNTAAQVIEAALRDIQPMLAAAGRSIAIRETSDTSCVIELTGFCGDCACSESYKHGIAELLREHAPQIVDIRFVEA